MERPLETNIYIIYALKTHSVHFPVTDMILLFFTLSNSPLSTFTTFPSADGHLGWFRDVAIVNCGMINPSVQVSLSSAGFNPLSHVAGSAIAGSYGSSIFSFLRHL